MADFNNSFSYSDIPTENYNWTISEVNNLYATLTDLQTKVTQRLEIQRTFNRLITRVNALEKKLLSLDRNFNPAGNQDQGADKNIDNNDNLDNSARPCSRNLRPRIGNSGTTTQQRLSELGLDALVCADDNFDLSLVKIEIDGDHFDLEHIPDFQNNDDDSRDKEWKPEDYYQNDIPMDDEEEEERQREKKPNPEIKPSTSVKEISAVRTRFRKKIPKACTICHKMLGSSWHLRRHMLGVHKSGRPYQCNGCAEIFHKWGHYVAHKESCWKLPANANKAKPEVALLKDIQSQPDYNQGQEGSSFQCKLCNNNIEHTPEEFLEHIKAEHPDPPLGQAKYGRPCPICLKNFTRNSRFRRHLYSAHKLGEFPSTSTATKDTFEEEHNSTSTSTVKLPCKLCNNGSEYTRAEFTAHIKAEHPDPLPQGRPAMDCPICLKTFSKNSHLKNHVYNVHKIGENFPNNSNLPLNCNICNEDGKEFTLEEFRTHFEEVHQNQWLKNLTESRPCPVCLQLFTKNVLLGEHIYSAHKIGELIQCEICKREFIVIESLKRHHIQLHKDVPLPTMLQQVQLTSSAVTTARSPRAPRPPVPLVSAVNEDGSVVSVHANANANAKVTKTIKDEGPFQCTRCGKLLKSKRSLQEHTPVCNGLSIHKCKECDLSFKYRKNLSVHVNKVHRQIQHLCNECGKGFACLAYLNRHIREVHRQDRSVRDRYRKAKKAKEEAAASNNTTNTFLNSLNYFSPVVPIIIPIMETYKSGQKLINQAVNTIGLQEPSAAPAGDVQPSSDS